MRVDYDGMSNTQTIECFVSLRQAAAQLGLSIVWLRSEAKAGRVPYLQAGNRMKFHLATVEAELIQRSATEGQTQTDKNTNDRESVAV